MKRLIAAFALALTTAAVTVAHPATAFAASGLALPVSGSGSGATFTGTFTLQRFVPSAGGVAAVGTLTGKVTDSLGATTTVAQNVKLPVNIGATTCDILHLDIGPIALDLLGLQVD